MNDFATYTDLPAAAPDPAKRVNYALGMVLGVEDFNQEFAYLSNRDRWTLRDLIGYGTAWGLLVSQQSDDANNPQVRVAPGVAVSPSGQLIKVCQDQCAKLKDWVSDPTNQETLVQQVGSPPTESVRLYVVLCYRDCQSDDVPIPGEPCRCEDETTAASRVTDDFCLEFRLKPPVQHEEDAVRRFVAWLRAVPLAGPGDVPATLEQFEQAVRQLEALSLSPPASPPSDPDWDLIFGSPPMSLRVPADRAAEYFRAAMRIWVTELRPKWRAAFPAGGCSCGCGSADASTGGPPEDCVLLASVSVPLRWDAQNLQWVIDTNNPVRIDQSDRPWLLSLRMIQQWLLTGAAPDSAPPAPSYGVVAAGVVAVGPVAAPPPGGSVIKTTPTFGGLTAAAGAAPGILNVAFTGYRPPDGTFQYIVKATPIDPAGTSPVVVTFRGFLAGAPANPTGLQLTVTLNGAPTAVAGRQFMIEVARFPLGG